MFTNFISCPVPHKYGEGGTPVEATQKPVELYRAFIYNHTLPNQFIIDLCSGTGTGAAAACSLGKNSYSIDTRADQIAFSKKCVKDIHLMSKVYAHPQQVFMNDYSLKEKKKMSVKKNTTQHSKQSRRRTTSPEHANFRRIRREEQAELRITHSTSPTNDSSSSSDEELLPESNSSDESFIVKENDDVVASPIGTDMLGTDEFAESNNDMSPEIIVDSTPEVTHALQSEQTDANPAETSNFAEKDTRSESQFVGPSNEVSDAAKEDTITDACNAVYLDCGGSQEDFDILKQQTCIDTPVEEVLSDDSDNQDSEPDLEIRQTGKRRKEQPTRKAKKQKTKRN
ncbi:MAG: site-specific DNA-methyltransferase [Cytophagales bacterium]|nr:site-specific DNA-methyltransferase [Cytophagales bacterium]